MTTVSAKGILLIYHRPALVQDAATVVDNIDAFARYSQFKVWGINTEYGFPPALGDLSFQVIILHYSLFGGGTYFIDPRFQDYLGKSKTSHKIAFFQDEFRYCQKRFGFLNRYGIDCVYTLVEPAYFHATYKKYTSVPKLVSHIPGYVSEGLLKAAEKFGKRDQDRTIDIGYRGRPLEIYMGKAAQEKSGIAIGFLERAAGLNLNLDIERTERKRVYGDAWYRFTANCRGFLGVEAGVSIFDLEDTVRIECEKRISMNPKITFEELHDQYLYQWEDKIPYRTISPRHFEAAAFRVCQILFGGKYSDILQPMVHYIPLKKDFSNFHEVIRLFSDTSVRRELTDNAYRDLIASGKYSYQKFIQEFDDHLIAAGLRIGARDDDDRVTELLERGSFFRRVRAVALGVRYHGWLVPLSVRKLVRPITQRVLYGNTDFKANDQSK
jgi:hypothetical protein